MLSMTKRLGKDTRIQGFSTASIVQTWNALITRLAMDFGVKLHGRRLQPGPALNVIVLMFDRLPEEEQIRWLREGTARLETMLDTDSVPPEGKGAQQRRLPIETETRRASKPVGRKKGR